MIFLDYNNKRSAKARVFVNNKWEPYVVYMFSLWNGGPGFVKCHEITDRAFTTRYKVGLIRVRGLSW
jgi:hypothetical protein